MKFYLIELKFCINLSAPQYPAPEPPQILSNSNKAPKSNNDQKPPPLPLVPPPKLISKYIDTNQQQETLLAPTASFIICNKNQQSTIACNLTCSCNLNTLLNLNYLNTAATTITPTITTCNLYRNASGSKLPKHSNDDKYQKILNANIVYDNNSNNNSSVQEEPIAYIDSQDLDENNTHQKAKERKKQQTKSSKMTLMQLTNVNRMKKSKSSQIIGNNQHISLCPMKNCAESSCLNKNKILKQKLKEQEIIFIEKQNNQNAESSFSSKSAASFEFINSGNRNDTKVGDDRPSYEKSWENNNTAQILILHNQNFHLNQQQHLINKNNIVKLRNGGQLNNYSLNEFNNNTNRMNRPSSLLFFYNNNMSSKINNMKLSNEDLLNNNNNKLSLLIASPPPPPQPIKHNSNFLNDKIINHSEKITDKNKQNNKSCAKSNQLPSSFSSHQLSNSLNMR